MTALHSAVGAWLREQRATSAQVSGAVYDASLAHQQIYDAIAARDSGAAQDAMRRHLEEVERYYWLASQ